MSKNRERGLVTGHLGRCAALICIALGMLGCMYSCGSGGCLENATTLPLAGFYSGTTKTAISVDSLEVRGIGAPGDSLLLAPRRGVSELYMPFRADYSSISWVFAFKLEGFYYPQLYDTITFGYNTIPYFASADCGAMYVYRVNSMRYTTHVIDSVAITDSLFTNVNKEQIQIFFRTAEQ